MVRLDNISVAQDGNDIVIKLNSNDQLNTAAPPNQIESPLNQDYLLKYSREFKFHSNSLPFITDLIGKLANNAYFKESTNRRFSNDIFADYLTRCQTLESALELLHKILGHYSISNVIRVLALCGYKVRNDQELYANNTVIAGDNFILKVYQYTGNINYKICRKEEADVLELYNTKFNKELEVFYINLTKIPCTQPLSIKEYLVYYDHFAAAVDL